MLIFLLLIPSRGHAFGWGYTEEEKAECVRRSASSNSFTSKQRYKACLKKIKSERPSPKKTEDYQRRLKEFEECKREGERTAEVPVKSLPRDQSAKAGNNPLAIDFEASGEAAIHSASRLDYYLLLSECREEFYGN